MTFRKIELRSKPKSSSVQPWDTTGFGARGTLPVKYAGKVNSVEVERAIFRPVMDLIKAEQLYTIDNLPDYPPAMIYRWPSEDGNPKSHVFAVCVYPNLKPAQYYLILQRISAKLRKIIEKVIRDGTKNGSLSSRVSAQTGTESLSAPVQACINSSPKHRPTGARQTPAKSPPTSRRAGPTHPWRLQKGKEVAPRSMRGETVKPRFGRK